MKKLDKIDIKILHSLTRDGRISWRELAEEVGLSLTPILRRVKQLESDGVIKGYTARLDEKRLFGAMAVFISITLDRQVDEVLHLFEKSICALPEVISGHLMSGEADYLLHAFVRDLDHYRELLSEITQIQGIAHIQSSFVLNTFKQQTDMEIEGRKYKN